MNDLPDKEHYSRSVYERVAGRLPQFLAGYLDHLRPGMKASWGGPFNGQKRREEAIRELVSALRPAAVVETGTYRGTSTLFLHQLTKANVYSVERDIRYFTYSRLRFVGNPLINIAHDDSRAFLQKLAMDHDIPKSKVLFYLDAHWNEDFPLREELSIIAKSWNRSAIVIDDFKVEGDEGYGFDTWGEYTVLGEAMLPEDIASSYVVLYPRAPSFEETGERRGSAVLLSPDIADLSSNLSRLRPSPTSSLGQGPAAQ